MHTADLARPPPSVDSVLLIRLEYPLGSRHVLCPEDDHIHGGESCNEFNHDDEGGGDNLIQSMAFFQVLAVSKHDGLP